MNLGVFQPGSEIGLLGVIIGDVKTAGRPITYILAKAIRPDRGPVGDRIPNYG